MAAILKVKTADGQWIDIPALVGAPGKDGADGKDGAAGATGATGADGNGIASAVLNNDYTLTLTFTDGTEYTTPSIRGEKGAKGDKGDKGDTGATGATGSKGDKGDKGDMGADGADGKTPVKGTDYWTQADQESIVQQVITALGTPVFGRVDVDNNIILTGELADGTYTIKYEDADGTVTEIGTITLKEEVEIVNQIPLSINTDGTQYVGANGEDGYKSGYRLNSNGAEASAAAFGVTGFIPVKAKDVIYFKNVNFTPGVESNGGGNYIAVYDTAFAKIDSVKSVNITTDHYLYRPVETYADSGLIKSISLLDGSRNYGYLRVSATGLNTDSIITVNQPIE